MWKKHNNMLAYLLKVRNEPKRTKMSQKINSAFRIELGTNLSFLRLDYSVLPRWDFNNIANNYNLYEVCFLEHYLNQNL